MLLSDSLTPKCLLKNLQRQNSSIEKKRVEKMLKKRKRPDTQQASRLCRFCHMVLKQGPNSPHIHTGFPGVAGKYIYCPSKVYSLYQDKGMAKEMKWNEFQKSPYYEAEMGGRNDLHMYMQKGSFYYCSACLYMVLSCLQSYVCLSCMHVYFKADLKCSIFLKHSLIIVLIITLL